MAEGTGEVFRKGSGLGIGIPWVVFEDCEV